MGSLVQDLPLLILENIFQFTFANGADSGYEDSCMFLARERLKMTIHLSAICHQWRKISLAFLFKDPKWFSSTHGLDYKNWVEDELYWFRTLNNAVQSGAASSIKSVELDCDLDTVVDGTALDEFSSRSMLGCVFPRVNTLTIKITPGIGSVNVTSSDATANAQAFCSTIRRIFPMATSITILYTGSSYTYLPSTLFFTLLPEFLIGESDISFGDTNTTDDSSISRLINISNMVPLCSICIPSFEFATPIMHVIRQNACTLVDISVDVCKLDAYKAMLLNDDQTLVMYPCLKKLHVGYSLWITDGDDMDTSILIEGEPFPALEYLSYCCPSSLLAKYILHGSNANLQRLNIGVKCKSEFDLIFASENLSELRFPSMNIFQVECLRHQMSFSSDNFSVVAQLARDIPCLILEGAYREFKFKDMEKHLNDIGTGLRVLVFGSLRITVAETLSLAKQFPMLQRLNVNLVWGGRRRWWRCHHGHDDYSETEYNKEMRDAFPGQYDEMFYYLFGSEEDDINFHADEIKDMRTRFGQGSNSLTAIEVAGEDEDWAVMDRCLAIAAIVVLRPSISQIVVEPRKPTQCVMHRKSILTHKTLEDLCKKLGIPNGDM